MKKGTAIYAIVIGFIIFSAFKIADNIIEKLGLEDKTARSYILANFVGMHDTGPMDENMMPKSFAIPYMNLLPSIISGDKTEAATEMCTYIKTYVNSEEFIIDYNSRKEDAMPLRDDKGRNITSLKRDKATIELNIKHYPNDVSYVADQQKELDQTQKGIDQINANAKKPFPNQDNWEKMYPSKPEVFIKQRLQEYLSLVATVDFKAALTEPDEYNKRKFVNPVYEKKDYKWKACFRAGKEVNDVVTAFVKEWLKGEIISSVKTKMKIADDPKIQATPQAKGVENTNGSISTSESLTNAPGQSIDSPVQETKAKKLQFGKLKSQLLKAIK
jgi:hypothetical protein